MFITYTKKDLNPMRSQRSLPSLSKKLRLRSIRARMYANLTSPPNGDSELRSPEWLAEKAFWDRRTALLFQHAIRLTSYNRTPPASGNCKGSWVIGTGCNACPGCYADYEIMAIGPSRFGTDHEQTIGGGHP